MQILDIWCRRRRVKMERAIGPLLGDSTSGSVMRPPVAECNVELMCGLASVCPGGAHFPITCSSESEAEREAEVAAMWNACYAGLTHGLTPHSHQVGTRSGQRSVRSPGSGSPLPTAGVGGGASGPFAVVPSSVMFCSVMRVTNTRQSCRFAASADNVGRGGGGGGVRAAPRTVAWAHPRRAHGP